jgi:hypothetical protein
MDDLHWHALRAGVFAIRRACLEWLRSGLTALAAIDFSRAGWMPLAADVSVLYRSGCVTFPDEVDEEFRRGAAIADTYVQRSIADLLKLTSEDRYARFAAYQAEVQTQAGIGFVLRYSGAYDPTCDLRSVLVRLRRLILSDKYQPYTVALGTALYETQLRKYSDGPDPVPLFERGTALVEAMRGIRAGIGVVGLLRPDMHPSGGRYTLSMDVFECHSENDAHVLLDRLRGSGGKQVETGVVAGKLLAVIAASGGYDSETGEYVSASYETLESLGRFDEPLNEILHSVPQD